MLDFLFILPLLTIKAIAGTTQHAMCALLCSMDAEAILCRVLWAVYESKVQEGGGTMSCSELLADFRGQSFAVLGE